ncbi:type VI secretion system baseplate subunit TssG [Phyllobacterium sp. 21LDTY02-6]|uniref:type VI secretion system baseplate subunit TssG n=1 Tax=Phyllobacterium sp. 21LDTY02-6 TaxID=2944903 RepID=UPI002020EC09|nr:type VI secretion system baseplate subunit TssG [Phyllobacterium sp. 21LDTY02-6]MCO4318065.1 type VI secretion system baseplate subunit TssG [Phyllobacterium sp. 21LDTY02-6]
MTLPADKNHDSLADLLERDPGRFEPTTAFRVAQAADEGTAITSPFGVSASSLPVAGFRRKGGKTSLRSVLGGILGPLGSLPPAYNEHVMREERNKSGALAAFLDIFSSRMAELFVDACEKYRLARLLRWDAGRGRNAFSTALFSLIGFGTKGMRERSGLDDDVLLRFSGFLASRTRNAANLKALLSEFCGLPVEVELFRGRWLSVPEDERSQMGRAAAVQLGVNAMAGTAIRDFSSSFRLVLGPLDYPDYLSLAPGSANVEEIFALTRLFVGPGLDFDIQLVLKKEQVPFCQLGQTGDPPRLGWNSWARVTPAVRDSGDAVIVASQHNLRKAA